MVCCSLDFLEAQEFSRVPSMLSNHMGRCRVVGDPIHPGSQRTPRLVLFQTEPQREMDVLKQIPPPIGIRFICTGEPLKGDPVSLRRLPVKVLLCTHGQIVVDRRVLLQVS